MLLQDDGRPYQTIAGLAGMESGHFRRISAFFGRACQNRTICHHKPAMRATSIREGSRELPSRLRGAFDWHVPSGDNNASTPTDAAYGTTSSPGRARPASTHTGRSTFQRRLLAQEPTSNAEAEPSGGAATSPPAASDDQRYRSGTLKGRPTSLTRGTKIPPTSGPTGGPGPTRLKFDARLMGRQAA